MAKGPVTVPTLVGGVPVNQTVSDNIEEYRYVRGVSLHDAVYPMPDGRVAKASAVVPDQTCIGVVVAVIDHRWCLVLTQGEIENYGDLTPAAHFYLSPEAGKLTSQPPTRAGRRVQFIGVALNQNDLLITPSMQRVMVVGEPCEDGRFAVHWNPAAAQFELG